MFDLFGLQILKSLNYYKKVFQFFLVKNTANTFFVYVRKKIMLNITTNRYTN